MRWPRRAVLELSWSGKEPAPGLLWLQAWGALCGRQVYNHSPLHIIFLFRNGITASICKSVHHISLGGKLSDSLRFMKKLVFFTLTSSYPRSAHLRTMLRSIRDGWRGRMGPAQDLD